MPMWILAVHPVAIIIFFIAAFLSLTIGIGTRHSLRSACSRPYGLRTPARGGYGNTSTLATFPDDSCKWFHGFSSFHKAEWRS